MKTKMYFGWWKTMIICLVTLGALAVVVLDIVMLVGTEEIRTASPAVAGTSMGAGIVVAFAALLILFNSFYSFKENHLIIRLGFFSDKLVYDNICGVKENTVTKEIFVLYKSENEKEGEQTIRLNLASHMSEKFLEDLRKHCPFVIVEPFTPAEKKKKK